MIFQIEGREKTYELQIDEIPSAQISFDNFITTSLLAGDRLQEGIKQNSLLPLNDGTPL
jgi:hypothetical protein